MTSSGAASEDYYHDHPHNRRYRNGRNNNDVQDRSVPAQDYYGTSSSSDDEDGARPFDFVRAVGSFFGLRDPRASLRSTARSDLNALSQGTHEG